MESRWAWRTLLWQRRGQECLHTTNKGQKTDSVGAKDKRTAAELYMVAREAGGNVARRIEP